MRPLRTSAQQSQQDCASCWTLSKQTEPLKARVKLLHMAASRWHFPPDGHPWGGYRIIGTCDDIFLEKGAELGGKPVPELLFGSRTVCPALCKACTSVGVLRNNWKPHQRYRKNSTSDIDRVFSLLLQGQYFHARVSVKLWYIFLRPNSLRWKVSQHVLCS